MKRTLFRAGFILSVFVNPIIVLLGSMALLLSSYWVWFMDDTAYVWYLGILALLWLVPMVYLFIRYLRLRRQQRYLQKSNVRLSWLLFVALLYPMSIILIAISSFEGNVDDDIKGKGAQYWMDEGEKVKDKETAGSYQRMLFYTNALICDANRYEAYAHRASSELDLAIYHSGNRDANAGTDSSKHYAALAIKDCDAYLASADKRYVETCYQDRALANLTIRNYEEAYTDISKAINTDTANGYNYRLRADIVYMSNTQSILAYRDAFLDVWLATKYSGESKQLTDLGDKLSAKLEEVRRTSTEKGSDCFISVENMMRIADVDMGQVHSLVPYCFRMFEDNEQLQMYEREWGMYKAGFGVEKWESGRGTIPFVTFYTDDSTWYYEYLNQFTDLGFEYKGIEEESKYTYTYNGYKLLAYIEAKPTYTHYYLNIYHMP